MSAPDFSVCICTRNRPEELRRALHAIARSGMPPAQIVVADDSTDLVTRDMVAAEFPYVTYAPGRRQGLGANRNNALHHVRGSHFLFLDDDAELGQDFLAQAASLIASAPAATILTGVELNHGTVVTPHKPVFLGFQKADYSAGDIYTTVVINATVFPRRLFNRMRFDESLVYGYDEVDIAVRSVLLHGHTILFRPELCNTHYPSSVNRAFYAPYLEASRIYVTFKRYAWVERRRLKALAFLLLALMHNFAHLVRRNGMRGTLLFWTTLRRSFLYIGRCAMNPEKYV